MKTKLLAIVLSMLMLVQPVMAVGMIGVESADEIAASIPEQAQEKNQEAEVMADLADGVVFFEDFTGHGGTTIREWDEVNNKGVSATPLAFETSEALAYADIRQGDQGADIVVTTLEDGNEVLMLSGGQNTAYRMITIRMYQDIATTSGFMPVTDSGKYELSYRYSYGIIPTHTHSHRVYDASGYEWINGGVSSTAVVGDWYTKTTSLTISDDGKWYYGSSLKDMGELRSGNSNDNGLSRFDIVLQNSEASTDGFLFYVDDVKLTKKADVDVTYVDKNGETLVTALMYEGDTVTLKHSTVGYTFATQFEINGVKYNDGDTYTIPYGTTALTIKAGRYDMPEDAPVNAIFYEDFDHTANAGFTNCFNPFTYVDEEFFGEHIPAISSYGGSLSYAEFDGKTTMRIGSTVSANAAYHGFRVKDVYLDKPGRYILTANWYTDLDPDVVTTSNTCTVLWNKTHLKDDDYNGNTTTFNGSHRQTWVTQYEEQVVTEDEDGNLKFGTHADAGNGMPSFLWYQNKLNTAATETTSYAHYIDSFTLQRFAPVTVNVVNESGAVLKTYSVYQTDEITLPTTTEIGYNANITYAGASYAAGATFTVPADAADVITITAERTPMPAGLPANTVLYEDFQNRTVGAATASSVVSYTAADFDGTTIAKDWYTPVSHTYEYAPGSTDDITEKYVIGGEYHDGRKLNIPNDIPVGVYTVYTNFYIDDVTLDTDDVDGDSNTTEYLNKISNMHRVWVGSEYAQITMEAFNAADERQTWVTDSFSFEIAENDGVKSMKMGSKEYTIDADEDIYIMLHWTVSNTSYNTPAIYHDDIYITQQKPVVFSTTFLDENGDAFAYTETKSSYDGYILPTAEDMGIDYLVEFVGEDGNTYYPGMEYPFEEGVTAAEFVVKKTNVVFFEDYENQFKTSGYITPTYAAGPFADATVVGGNINNNVNGTNSNVISVDGSSIASSTPEFIKLSPTAPGIYKFSMDVEIMLEKASETDLVDTAFYVNLQRISGWNGMGSNVYLKETEPKKTLTGYLEIYETEDGELYHRLVDHTRTGMSIYNSDGSGYIKQFRTGLVFSSAFISSTEARATYHVSFDNVKVEYTPFSPENTDKASYRELNEGETGGPEGIRFAAYVSNNQRELASEYGFVVTLKDNLPTTDGVTDYTKLNLKGIDSVSATVTTTGKNDDGITVVAAAAYNGTVDRVYVQDGKVFGLQGLYDTFYTAVLYGIDTDVRKKAVFVARPYAKIDGIYYYGDCHETSYNDVKAAAEAANA